ncbi:uncharacterized protein EI90DRAFT_3068229 [Cantharellus anzutake]|uniref:uncharacterized protein n=1 Tax=Cantharellus anzutake TaxID=1750568 RepID=UPI0019067DCF|nr:uncharacterized protein EI90DRAFT_3068229 [Cantharellus anzutake]KAF8327191.1 hypothetical protein EI90DRAFT_3068229 [Cantharellus anzutake]
MDPWIERRLKGVIQYERGELCDIRDTTSGEVKKHTDNESTFYGLWNGLLDATFHRSLGYKHVSQPGVDDLNTSTLSQAEAREQLQHYFRRSEGDVGYPRLDVIFGITAWGWKWELWQHRTGATRGMLLNEYEDCLAEASAESFVRLRDSVDKSLSPVSHISTAPAPGTPLPIREPDTHNTHEARTPATFKLCASDVLRQNLSCWNTNPMI